MANIFQIQSEYIQLMNDIQEQEGELTQELSDRLAIVESDLQTKSQGYISVIKTLDAECDIIDLEIKRLQSLKKVRNNTIERLKGAISQAMTTFEIEKIETPLNKITFRNSKSVNIIDVEMLPNTCVIIERKPISKTEIRKLIENGIEVSGAELIESKTLQIK